jgi:hypothetical protein
LVFLRNLNALFVLCNLNAITLLKFCFNKFNNYNNMKVYFIRISLILFSLFNGIFVFGQSFSGDAQPCEGSQYSYGVSNLQAGAKGFVWTVVAGTGEVVGSRNGNSVNIRWDLGGPGKIKLAYTYSVTNSDNTVSDYNTSAFYDVNVNAPGILNVNPWSNANVCSGESITLSASVQNTTATYSYSWSNGIVGSSISVSPLSNTNYTVTATSKCFTLPTQTVIVSVYPKPIVTTSTSAANNKACAGQTISLSAFGANSYKWSGAGLTSTSGASVNATVPSATTTYSVVGTNTYGCSSTSSMAITVPTITVSGKGTICLGGTKTLTATGASSYTWSPLGSITGYTGTGNSSAIVKPTESVTTYTATAIKDGCTVSHSADVYVKRIPVTPFIGGRQNLCNTPNGISESYSVSNTWNSNDTYNSFVWSVSGNATFSTDNVSPTVRVGFSPIASQVTISVKEYNECGSATGSFFVYLAQYAPATPTAPTMIGGGTTACQFVNSYFSKMVAGVSNEWSLTPSNAGTIKPYGTSGGSEVKWNSGFKGYATVAVRNSNGCGTSGWSSSSPVEVKGGANPTKPTGQISVCNQATSTYSTSSVTGTKTWQLLPLEAGVIIPKGVNDIDIKWNSSFKGKASLNVRNTDACGVSDWSMPLDIVVAAPLTISSYYGTTHVCNKGQDEPFEYEYYTHLSPVPRKSTLIPSSAGVITDYPSFEFSVNWNETFVGNATMQIDNGCISSKTVKVLNCTVLGDNFDGAIPAGTLAQGATFVDTKNNSSVNGFKNILGQASNDVFYSFTITAPSNVMIDHCNSAITDSYMWLYNSDKVLIGSNDDFSRSGCNRFHSFISQNLAPGTYFIVSEGFSTNSGNITTKLTVQPCSPAPGNVLSNPIVIGNSIGSCLNYSDYKNNAACFGNDYFGHTSDDIYYKFTLTTPQSVSISTCSTTGQDPYLYLLDVNGTNIASNDDNGPICTGRNASISKDLVAGVYYIVLEQYSNRAGYIKLEVKTGCPSARMGDESIVKDEEHIIPMEVTIYPNPTDKNAYLSIPAFVDNVSVKVSDVSGRVVQVFVATSAQTEINTSTMSNGIYYLSFQLGDKIVTKKLQVIK